mmetsp:Transcript_57315/g.125515  ORF Transcript_57315/g.125515 Transcript_57315/m.125515 type:complete len:238 (-) Transcript_57315:532-1245(-)
MASLFSARSASDMRGHFGEAPSSSGLGCAFFILSGSLSLFLSFSFSLSLSFPADLADFGGDEGLALPLTIGEFLGLLGLFGGDGDGDFALGLLLALLFAAVSGFFDEAVPLRGGDRGLSPPAELLGAFAVAFAAVAVAFALFCVAAGDGDCLFFALSSLTLMASASSLSASRSSSSSSSSSLPPFCPFSSSSREFFVSLCLSLLLSSSLPLLLFSSSSSSSSELLWSLSLSLFGFAW